MGGGSGFKHLNEYEGKKDKVKKDKVRVKDKTTLVRVR